MLRLPVRCCRLLVRASSTRAAACPGRPDIADVERISRGDAAKRRGTGSRAVPHRLNEAERLAWELAKRRYFVTLAGSGYRRERKGSPLGNSWRQFCDANAFPAVSVQQGEASTSVVVDLSPLREQAADALLAARDTCLRLAASLGVGWDDIAPPTGAQRILALAGQLPVDPAPATSTTAFTLPEDLGEDVWRLSPIWELQPITVSFSTEDRAAAKALAEALALELCGEVPQQAAVKPPRRAARRREEDEE